MLAGKLRRIGVGTDVVLTVILQGINATAAYAVGVLIVRGLSKGDAGLFFLAQAFVGIALTVADFGITAVAAPRIFVSRSLANPALKAGIQSRILFACIAWLGLNIALLLKGDPTFLLVGNIFFLSVFSSGKIAGPRQFFDFLWRVKGRAYVSGTIAAGDSLLMLLLMFLLYQSGALSLLWVVTIWATVSIPGLIITVAPFIGRMRRAGFFRLKVPRRYYSGMLLAALPVALMSFLGQGFAYLERFVLNGTLGEEAVAAYSAAIMPILGMAFIPLMLGIGISPVVAQAHRGVRRTEDLNETVSIAVRLLFTVMLTVVAGAFLFSDLIISLMGEGYGQEAYILRLYSITGGCNFLVMLIDQILLAVEYRKQTLYGGILAFVSALVLELVLIGYWGIVGVLVGKSLALILQLSYQHVAVPVPVRSALLNGLRRMAIPAAAVAAGVLLSEGFPLPLRALVTFGLLAGALVLTRAVPLEDIRTFRRLQAS